MLEWSIQLVLAGWVGKNSRPLATIPPFLSVQGLRCRLQPPSTASSPLVSLGSHSQARVRLQAVPCASDLGLSSWGGRKPLGFLGQRGLWGFFALEELPLPPCPDPGAAQALRSGLGTWTWQCVSGPTQDVLVQDVSLGLVTGTLEPWCLSLGLQWTGSLRGLSGATTEAAALGLGGPSHGGHIPRSELGFILLPSHWPSRACAGNMCCAS